MILRYVVPSDGLVLSKIDRFEPLGWLWTGLYCPSCGASITPSRLAFENWNVTGSWFDGHVEATCGPCGLTAVHAFDVSPLKVFPRLAGQLVGKDLQQLAFTESMTEKREGIDEEKQRLRVWTGDGVKIVLRHGCRTNYPPNEMQWYFDHDSGGSIEAPGISLTIGYDLSRPSAEPELEARWLELVRRG